MGGGRGGSAALVLAKQLARLLGLDLHGLDVALQATQPRGRLVLVEVAQVRLTAQEREMASMMGMTVEEYAKNKLALQKEGKLN